MLLSTTQGSAANEQHGLRARRHGEKAKRETGPAAEKASSSKSKSSTTSNCGAFGAAAAARSMAMGAGRSDGESDGRLLAFVARSRTAAAAARLASVTFSASCRHGRERVARGASPQGRRRHLALEIAFACFLQRGHALGLLHAREPLRRLDLLLLFTAQASAATANASVAGLQG